MVEEMKAEEYAMLALVEKTREVIRKESLALELFEILDARMNWLIRFCVERGIPLPVAQIATEEQRIKYLMGEIAGAPPSDESLQGDDPTKSGQNLTALHLITLGGPAGSAVPKTR